MALQLVDNSRDQEIDLNAANRAMAGASAEQCLAWVKETFGANVVLTSSFGAESAVMLHMASQWFPQLRVIFVDTGYLFAETYRFANELTQRFDIDLRVYSPLLSPAHQEALYGKRYEGSPTAQKQYLQDNKVEPLDRALRELAPRVWLAGLRKHQTAFRNQLNPLELHDGGIFKVHPILDWGEEQVHAYMAEHKLPFHPLYAKGYHSIGDEHSTFPVLDGEDSRAGRILGVHRECGIHLPRAEAQPQFGLV